MPKIEDEDLYELLGVESNADASEIKKAYRKKALGCHPDKNPDNPRAKELFLELSKALEILGDPSARAAYDRVLNAKKAAQLRHKQLDAKRRKLVDDLERREREAEIGSKKYKTHDERSDAERLHSEIERLQKEGSRLLKEEQERMARLIVEESSNVWRSTDNRVKVKWRKESGGYDESSLRMFFKKYGDVKELIVLPEKGTALVEFSTKESSEMAIDLEKGLPENPLSLKWANKSKQNAKFDNKNTTSSTISDKDYESLVLMKMRQAAERQKLIDQMMQEERE